MLSHNPLRRQRDCGVIPASAKDATSVTCPLPVLPIAGPLQKCVRLSLFDSHQLVAITRILYTTKRCVCSTAIERSKSSAIAASFFQPLAHLLTFEHAPFFLPLLLEIAPSRGFEYPVSSPVVPRSWPPAHKPAPPPLLHHDLRVTRCACAGCGSVSRYKNAMRSTVQLCASLDKPPPMLALSPTVLTVAPQSSLPQ